MNLRRPITPATTGPESIPIRTASHPPGRAPELHPPYRMLAGAKQGRESALAINEGLRRRQRLYSHRRRE
jgi:hypothetical protein